MAESVPYRSGCNFTSLAVCFIFVFFYSHPNDDDGKIDRNLLVIDNV